MLKVPGREHESSNDLGLYRRGGHASHRMQGAYPSNRSKRTSLAPSPSTALKQSSGSFVFWELHRVIEQPEALRQS